MTATVNPYLHRKKPVNVLTESYLTRASEHSQSRIVNIYLQKSSADEDLTAYMTPGRTSYITNTENEVRGMLTNRGTLYIVNDNKLYSVNSSLTKTLLGTLNTTYGDVLMTSTNNVVFIYDFSSAYIYDIDNNTFEEVDDEDLPLDSATTTSIFGFIILHVGRKFYWSELGTTSDPAGTVWQGVLAFASAERIQQNIAGVHTFNDKLYLFGETSAELYEAVGGTDPFASISGITIPYGLAAPKSKANGSKALFLLARGSNGQACVLMIDKSFSDSIISDAGLNYQIYTYERDFGIDDAIANVIEYEGKEFYQITFPKANKTWQYDTTLKIWTELSSRREGVDGKWRTKYHVAFNNKNVVSDFYNSTIYYLDRESFVDAEETILRTIVFPVLADDQNNTEIVEFLVDIEHSVALTEGQGSDPVIGLRWTRDGIQSGVIERSIGAIGVYDLQVRWDMNGTARKWVGELTMSDPVAFKILGCYIKLDYGLD